MKLSRERSAANLQAAFEAEGIGNMKDGKNLSHKTGNGRNSQAQARIFNAPILDPTLYMLKRGISQKIETK